MKFRRSIALFFQTTVALAALVGSAMSLIWLEQKNAALTVPSVRCWDENAPLVLVDAGHGGHDGGAVAHDIVEKNLSLDLARRVQRELEAAGVRVRLTRTSDVFISLDERAAQTEKHAADAFVSVHLNTDGDGGDAEGIETYHAEVKPFSSRQLSGTPAVVAGGKAAAPQATLSATSADLATLVQRMVCTTTKAQNRGTKTRGYAVVARARCPAILVECGFITSPAESARLKREAYRDQVAEGIARGVVLFLQSRPGSPAIVATAVK